MAEAMKAAKDTIAKARKKFSKDFQAMADAYVANLLAPRAKDASRMAHGGVVVVKGKKVVVPKEEAPVEKKEKKSVKK
jgi:hypothetical protein